MFFHETEQLQEIFEDLEEKNLFLIKYTQEVEQALEEVQSRYSSKKSELNLRKQQLVNSKIELEKDIQAKNKEINDLTHIRSDSNDF